MDIRLAPPGVDDDAGSRPLWPQHAGHLLWRWWRSRYGARLLREVAIVIVLLGVYRLGRTLGREEAARAFANAREVLRVEDWFGLDNERSLQQAALGHLAVIGLLNRYYAMES